MANNDHLDDYEMFYQEIPASDHYLQGFEIEIEDHVDDTNFREGLDASQVSRLAEDTYDQGKPIQYKQPSSEQEQQLFSDED